VQHDAGARLDALVDQLKRGGNVRSAEIERALRRVHRHLFVETYFPEEEGRWRRRVPAPLDVVYSDAALITRAVDGWGTSSSSQPALVAIMLEQLELAPGMRVLEIGAGTGYNAALIAELVGDPTLVTTIDYQADVAEDARAALARAGYDGVRVIHGDGFEGADDGAPFDRIVATVGCPDVSPRWVEQLAPGGFMLLPLRHAGANPLVRVDRRDGTPVGRVVGHSGFMAIQGALADPAYGLPVPRGAEPVAERPLWPDLVDAAWSGALGGFWFYLGLRDPRAAIAAWPPEQGFGLYDARAGSFAAVEPTRLAAYRDANLLDDLERLHGDWLAAGAPNLLDYTITFQPAAPPPWALARKYHRWSVARSSVPAS
jgi:protein-L-isoaspartate(D-aspartate) O-methyltransferase